MAFSDNQVAVARESKVFVGLETTPGTQIASSACQLVLMNGAGSANQSARLLPDPQFRNTRSRLLPITGAFEAGKWNFPTLFKVVGATGIPVVSEIDTILQCLMGKASTSTNSAWFGTTPNRSYQMLGVQAQGTTYPSMSIYMKTGHYMAYIAGATCNQAEFNVVGNELVKCGFSGEFMRMGWCGTDRVSSGSTGTALAVVDGGKYMLANSADSFSVTLLDPTTLLKQEAGSAGVPVTAVTYGAAVSGVIPATLTLGVSQTWVSGTIVAPFLPIGTEIGVPVYGKYGLVRLSPWADTVGPPTFANQPATTQVISSAKITVTNGIKYHADLKDGTQYPTEYVVPAFREVKGELNLFFYRNVPTFRYKGQTDPLVPDYVIVPCQDKSGSAGKIVQFHMPRVLYESPNISGEDEKTAQINFSAIASSQYDDELGIAIIGS